MNTVPSIAQKLRSTMERKSSNLCVSADTTQASELLELAEAVGPEICMLKTHIDIVIDFTPDLIAALRSVAKRHDFLLLEDRKFADIGAISKQQYCSGVHRIVEWADLVTVHLLPGTDILEALKQGAGTRERGALLVAQMSSSDNLINEEYTAACRRAAELHRDFVAGFICQERIDSDPALLHCMPGVAIGRESDALGQRYTTPQRAINERGADLVIVGRGICKAADPTTEARRYREAARRTAPPIGAPLR